METVIFPKKLRNKFVRAAKKSFPVEEFCLLLGQKHPDGTFRINDLYFPPDRGDFSTPDSVNSPAYWYKDAAKHAFKNGDILLGDLHSHCYDLDTDGYVEDAIPSLADLERISIIQEHCAHYYAIFGILSVTKSNGRTGVTLNMFPALSPLKIEDE
jgi:hypothetical protein